MKRFAILLATTLALATPAFAQQDTCDENSVVATVLDTAAKNGLEAFDYKGDDFTKYVNAVQKLFAPSFGNGADEVIEVVMDEDDIAVALAKDGCIFAFGTVDPAGRAQVLTEAGFPTN